MLKRKSIVIFISPIILMVSCSLSHASSSNASLTQMTIEEMRLSKAKLTLPSVVNRLESRVMSFKSQLEQARNLTALTQLVIRHGRALWKEAVISFNNKDDYDDRALYWSRLQMVADMRSSPAFGELLFTQQERLIWQFELFSRGQHDIKFDKGANKKVLITGFDPFHLDSNIKQSNPSGVSALALDDLFVSVDGQSIEIESLILPVRFADFDQGMVEEILKPLLQKRHIDMLITISMGRKNIELERFPALRRSSLASDNMNIKTGATKNNPLIPKLNAKALKGPEFLESSLPAEIMMQAKGAFEISDNRKVTSLQGKVTANRLSQLAGLISVTGSGGGYLSNEVSYRTLLLRDKYRPVLPVGHIHTPSIKGFDKNKSSLIVKQIKAMIIKAIPKL